ncbi:MAG TPA: hypothetical protein VFA46_13760 [Actinomycetes bacterium]|jgi:hypothetical protein|nr:hypothetical protein [Actinomycetes bacterium]
MAFLDEARQLAEQASRSIEQGLEQVRGRIDEVQRQRRFNDLGRYLGLLVYRARRAGTGPDETEVERICAEMAAIEATLPGGGGDGPGARTGPGPGPQPGAGSATDPGATSTTGPDSRPTSGPPAGPPRGYSLDDV